MKKVVVAINDRQALSEKFGVSVTSVSLALNFRTNSIMARRIRSYAVNILKGIPNF